jgi:nicotinamidase-related amidase
MPLNKLDETPALIVIDLQKAVLGLPAEPPIQDVVNRTRELARAFRERGLPVVLVNVSGRAPGRTDAGAPKLQLKDDWTELLPELKQHPDDYLVTKQRVGAFIGTPLDEYLRKRGVTQVVLAGVATSIGVESTARSAYDLGYNVALVVDAMADMDQEMHHHSIEKVFPRLGETAATADVLKLLHVASGNSEKTGEA